MPTVEGYVGEGYDAANARVRPDDRLIPLLLRRGRSPYAGFGAAALAVTAVTVLLYPLAAVLVLGRSQPQPAAAEPPT